MKFDSSAVSDEAKHNIDEELDRIQKQMAASHTRPPPKVKSPEPAYVAGKR